MQAISLNAWAVALLVALILLEMFSIGLTVLARTEQKEASDADIEAKVAKLTVSEGDVLVLSFPGHLTQEQVNRIKSNVWGCLPFHSFVVVLHSGMSLSAVMTPSPGE